MLIAFPLFSWGRESMCHKGGGHQRIATRVSSLFPLGVFWELKKLFMFGSRHLWLLSPIIDNQS